MRLLIDEDSQGHLLLKLLRDRGHDVLTVAEAGLSGQPDAEVFALARQELRVLLTRNADDFEVLYDSEPDQAGILAEYQGSIRNKNMNEVEIAQAISDIEASGWDIAGQFVPLNVWNYDKAVLSDE